MGFKEKKVDEQNYVFTKEARGNRPKTEILLRSPKNHDDKPRLFEKMDDPSIDVIAYTGHAGYGHRVDSAINDGVRGSGEGKVVVLMQCWGVGNVESLERAFPDAQVISTTEPSTDNHDQFMFEKLLDGIVQRKSYGTMAKEVSDGMRNAWWKDDADPDKHFFFPNNRELLGQRLDRDRDGVRDLTDHIFNIVYPKRLDAAGGVRPSGAGHRRRRTVVSLSRQSARCLGHALQRPAAGRGHEAKWTGQRAAHRFLHPSRGDLHAFSSPATPAAEAQRADLDALRAPRQAISQDAGLRGGAVFGQEAGLDDTGTMALSLTMWSRPLTRRARGSGSGRCWTSRGRGDLARSAMD